MECFDAQSGKKRVWVSRTQGAAKLAEATAAIGFAHRDCDDVGLIDHKPVANVADDVFGRRRRFFIVAP